METIMLDCVICGLRRGEVESFYLEAELFVGQKKDRIDFRIGQHKMSCHAQWWFFPRLQIFVVS